MIKLKKLIKENVWDRKFGEPLPTLKDIAEKHQRKEKQELTESRYGWEGKVEDLNDSISDNLRALSSEIKGVDEREMPKRVDFWKRVDKMHKEFKKLEKEIDKAIAKNPHRVY